MPRPKLEIEAKVQAEKLGYRVLTKGWPDQLWVKDNEVVFVEVKDGHDRLSLSQRDLLDVIASLGLPVRVLRRGDTSGEYDLKDHATNERSPLIAKHERKTCRRRGPKPGTMPKNIAIFNEARKKTQFVKGHIGVRVRDLAKVA